MKINYFITFDYLWLFTITFAYLWIFIAFLVSHNLLNEKLKKKMKNVNNREKLMEIKESMKIEAIQSRTFSFTQNYAELIISVRYDEIISPCLIISTYKAINIKIQQKIYIKNKLPKSTFNKSVNIATEHALILFLFAKNLICNKFHEKSPSFNSNCLNFPQVLNNWIQPDHFPPPPPPPPLVR